MGRKSSVVVAVGAGLLLWRVLKAITIPVSPDDCVVVFQVRRRRVLFTTDDGCRESVRSNRPLDFFLRRVLRLYSQHHLCFPRTSFITTFTMPKTALEPPGEMARLTVKHVHTSDGMVDIVLDVQYVIPFGGLERYLAAVGPYPPTELIAAIAAQVMKVTCAEVSMGILLSRTRRDGVFMMSFRERFQTKLLSMAAVELHDVTVNSVTMLNCD